MRFRLEVGLTDCARAVGCVLLALLSGLSKKMIAQRHGEAKFKEWRRSYATRPPEVSSFSSNYPGNDERYVR